MAPTARRVGTEKSKTRETLLDCVETMMLEDGYAGVTYRALAAKAGVTSSLVQYYFPTLDHIFLAAITRYSDRNLRILTKVLQSRSEDPLRALWEYSWDEATGALMAEFTALGNHRAAIRAHIAEVTERVRAVQLEVLAVKYGEKSRLEGDLPLGAALLLITGLPKLLNLEQNIGVRTGHADLVDAFERMLDAIEPVAKPSDRKDVVANSALMTASRSSGARRTEKLGAILRSTETLMLEEGYGAVTFRSVAAKAEVTAGLVQYYFHSLDDLFIAVLRRSTDRLIGQLAEASQSEAPLRAVWQYANNRIGTALLMEFLALANHRSAIRSVIGEGGERVRQTLVATVSAKWKDYGLDEDDLPPAAVLFLLSCIPRMTGLEEAAGTMTGHVETIALVERFLDQVEPQ